MDVEGATMNKARIWLCVAQLVLGGVVVAICGFAGWWVGHGIREYLEINTRVEMNIGMLDYSSLVGFALGGLLGIACVLSWPRILLED